MPIPIKAVLLDVGGPIDTEVTREDLIDAQIRAAVVAEGIPVSNADFAAADAWAVAVFAPNAYHAITWYLTRHDPEVARRLGSLHFPGGDLEVRPGIAGVLRALHTRGLLLGLAANQPTRVVEALDGHGIGHLFAHREVSGHHGFRKPDVRLFLRACEDLGAEAR